LKDQKEKHPRVMDSNEKNLRNLQENIYENYQDCGPTISETKGKSYGVWESWRRDKERG
jgi:hypothetical protein